MNSYEYPLVERLEQVYVLTETYQLLSNQLEDNHYERSVSEKIKEDLKKIEQELIEVTGEKYREDLAVILNKEFFFPEMYHDFE